MSAPELSSRSTILTSSVGRSYPISSCTACISAVYPSLSVSLTLIPDLISSVIIVRVPGTRQLLDLDAMIAHINAFAPLAFLS